MLRSLSEFDVCSSLNCVQYGALNLRGWGARSRPVFRRSVGAGAALSSPPRDLLVLVYFISQFVLVYNLDVPLSFSKEIVLNRNGGDLSSHCYVKLKNGIVVSRSKMV